MSKKRTRDETQEKALEDVGQKKAAKRRPQAFMIGDGYPVPLKAAFDILSPHPISGVRVPLEKLFAEVHKMGLGVSRLGPLTADQLNRDLKSPYATIAGNALMMGIMITVAQMEHARRQAFSFERGKFLKALREYFHLKQIELHDYLLSSGKMREPANPGIPYAPEKYLPEKLAQLTNDLSKLANTTQETSVRHQKEWDNFNDNYATAISNRVLRESPANIKIDKAVKEISENMDRSESVKTELIDTIQAAREKIITKAADDVKNIKPTSEKAKKMVQESYAAMEKESTAVSKDGSPVTIDFSAREGIFKELAGVAINKNAENDLDRTAEVAAATSKKSKDKSISDVDLVSNLASSLEGIYSQSLDASKNTGTFAGFTKNQTDVTSQFKKQLRNNQMKEINQLNQAQENLMKEIKQSTQSLEKAPNKSH